MKKIISVFLAVLMLAGSCTAFAASNEDASAQGQDFSQAGFRYVSPWPDLEGELVWYLASYYPGQLVRYLVFYSTASVEGMTDAELDEYLLTDQALVIYDVIAVRGLPRSDLDEFISTLRTPEIPEDHPRDELFSTFIHQKDIVLENGWELLVQRMEQFNADGTPAEDLVPESLPEENREEVRKLLEDVELFCSGIEETAYSAPGDVGSTISFTGTDLDGNEVSSADLFAGSDVTMINVWATWCPPCKAELPDLAKLNKQFAEKNCQIIGLCLDAEDALQTAQQLVKDSGYVNVVGQMTADFDWAQSCTAIPTSFFVDSQGKILIDPVVGAMVQTYPQALEDALKQMN